ncbi:flavodoxin family protein [Clostridium estertheticum]|uniref:flavodoxin family protein n=1 Tax=Clostridium estertheticum TaxID=238834 RepID=UPI001CF55D18|nr:flavodoxin family protein [Clostridium estertheticum]MCB2354586.1 flavodoxin family protein [Clostridium estertheticum]MCB2358512.1 flavodoxin family protein [Clostridium estertheticum]WAG40834.1 flavodoxin family protein [Clostridium estertheticum]
MKITVITGSPHKNGTSALLADKFIQGANEAGHEILRFDAAFEEVKPCLACDYCASHDGQCVRKDVMNTWYKKLIESDMIVFVTPLYYYGMSSQIKAVIDRFHANNEKLAGNKKSMLLATSYGADDWTMEALEKNYESILRFMNWNDAGKLFATGCPVREVVEQTNFPNQAYVLGKSLQ